MQFMQKVSPAAQPLAGRNPEACFASEIAPSLALLNKAYGEKSATMWLLPQISNLSEYCGCRDKITDTVAEELAETIAVEFCYMKVSELLLFFHWFKAGRYGRFYGAVDPLVITTALHSFAEDRRTACAKIALEQERRRREQESQGGMTYEEYKRLKAERESNENNQTTNPPNDQTTNSEVH